MAYFDPYKPQRHCFWCGQPSGQFKYCGEHEAISRQRKKYTILSTILKTLLQVGDYGIPFDPKRWFESLIEWNWVETDGDGYYYLTEEAIPKAKEFLRKF